MATTSHLHLAMMLGLAASSILSTAHAADSSINLRRSVVVDVVQQTKDAVVNISTTVLVPRRMSMGPFWQDLGPTVNVPAQSLGSGFIIHPDGYLVTNNHVIDRARQIMVELTDGRKLPAELISADAALDLAILRIASDKPLPALTLGDSSDLMIGEPTIAVGNPLGFTHSVSTGIVSAMHRDLKDPEGKVMLSDVIQTDAAINPGNSGGPLLNAYGQVIGINTAIRGDAQNIGFAIQVNRLRDLIPVLMNPATATKVDVPLKLSERRSVEAPATVKSQVLMPDGAVVRSINGEPVANIVDAYAALLKAKVGVKLAVATEKQTLDLTPRAAPIPDVVVHARKRLGVVVEQMTPLLAQKMDLRLSDGILVTEVARNSAAWNAGVRPGDVIIRLGPFPVKTLADFGGLIDQLPDSGKVYVTLVRENQVGYGILNL